MDPITAGIFVAASLGTTLLANRSEAKAAGTANMLQTEQAQLQAAESAYERTKALRRNLSANLALSGAGYGGTSGFRGVAVESITDYFADISSLQFQGKFGNVAGASTAAQIKSSKFGKDVVAGANAAQLASQLGLFSSKVGK